MNQSAGHAFLLNYQSKQEVSVLDTVFQPFQGFLNGEEKWIKIN